MGLQTLGVPLHSKPEGVAGQLDPFDHPIRGESGGTKGGCQAADALVVQAVHLSANRSQDLSQVALRLNLDRMC
jgi:hypothetical protein